jgi:putative endonuclease
MPAWFVYLLHCGDGSLYTGVSTDVVARIEKHNRGQGSRYTRSRLPVALAHVEKKRSRSAALRREAAVKALSRVEKLALIAGGPRSKGAS